MTTPAAEPPRFISRKLLIAVSAIGDGLDFLGFGAFPFFWSVVIDAPITILHFLYAGPRALVVLAEYIPMVGFLPIYTIAALAYDKPANKSRPPETTVIDV